jgi:hypothetical protein
MADYCMQWLAQAGGRVVCVAAEEIRRGAFAKRRDPTFGKPTAGNASGTTWHT